MRRILATFCLCVWMLVGCTSPAKLDGRWRPVSALLGGKRYPIEAFDGATLNVDANHYEFAGDRGRCAVVPGGPPARLDIDGVEGPNAGKHIPAIYLLSGDTLRVCYQLGAGERPTEFISPPGTLVFLVSYVRAAK